MSSLTTCSMLELYSPGKIIHQTELKFSYILRYGHASGKSLLFKTLSQKDFRAPFLKY